MTERNKILKEIDEPTKGNYKNIYLYSHMIHFYIIGEKKIIKTYLSIHLQQYSQWHHHYFASIV